MNSWDDNLRMLLTSKTFLVFLVFIFLAVGSARNWYNVPVLSDALDVSIEWFMGLFTF